VTHHRGLRWLRAAPGALVLFALWAAIGPLAPAVAQPDPNAAMAVYRRKLEEYTRAREAFDAAAIAYWTTITEKRRGRIAKRRNGEQILLDDYVLSQPPVYAGPPRPVDPSAPDEPEPPPPRKYIPVVADILHAAAEHYKFTPQRPRSELEYKRAYAEMAAAAGLTRKQIVRIYAFESGGNGKYDVQAGLEYERPNARAISTALGYNQLLHINSVSLLAEKGDKFVAALRAKAAQLSGEPKQALDAKIAAVQRMIAVSRTVPVAWSEHEKLANTPKGLGMHALNLDIDVGPLLQTQKLVDSVLFARRKGYEQPLTAAELEMMNLTGDGNGIDMITMPAAWRERVPTSNFFRPAGYERNPVAIRNNVVAKLIAVTNVRMDEECRLQGAKDMAAVFPKPSLSAER
jgi:hypothetical protein